MSEASANIPEVLAPKGHLVSVSGNHTLISVSGAHTVISVDRAVSPRETPLRDIVEPEFPDAGGNGQQRLASSVYFWTNLSKILTYPLSEKSKNRWKSKMITILQLN